MREQTFEKLSRMKLHGMAQALEQQLQQAETSSLSFEERLAQLVDAQWLWRENRAAATRLRKARLKQPASLEDVNYRHPVTRLNNLLSHEAFLSRSIPTNKETSVTVPGTGA